MYSTDFRRQVLKIGKREGLSVRALSVRFGVSVGTIMNWKETIAPIARRNRKPRTVFPEALLADVQAYPDSYCYERADRLGVSTTGIWRALKRLKMTYKKKPAPSQSRSRQKSCILQKD